jgi:hypothetical protein
VTGELVAVGVEFMTRRENFIEKFSAALGSLSGVKAFCGLLLVDSNLAAARVVLGVVDELLMNPVNFYVDDPSCLINGHSD